LEADASMGAIAKGFVLGLPAAAQRERRLMHTFPKSHLATR